MSNLNIVFEIKLIILVILHWPEPIRVCVDLRVYGGRGKNSYGGS